MSRGWSRSGWWATSVTLGFILHHNGSQKYRFYHVGPGPNPQHTNPLFMVFHWLKYSRSKHLLGTFCWHYLPCFQRVILHSQPQLLLRGYVVTWVKWALPGAGPQYNISKILFNLLLSPPFFWWRNQRLREEINQTLVCWFPNPHSDWSIHPCRSDFPCTECRSGSMARTGAQVFIMLPPECPHLVRLWWPPPPEVLPLSSHRGPDQPPDAQAESDLGICEGAGSVSQAPLSLVPSMHSRCSVLCLWGVSTRPRVGTFWNTKGGSAKVQPLPPKPTPPDPGQILNFQVLQPMLTHQEASQINIFPRIQLSTTLSELLPAQPPQPGSHRLHTAT